MRRNESVMASLPAAIARTWLAIRPGDPPADRQRPCQKPSEVSIAPQVSQYRQKRKRVDDDDSMRNSTERLVRSFGFRTASFSSARDFLGSAQVEDRACLLLDVRMPGMDGLDLQRLLGETRNRLPIIFVTARAKEDEERRALRAGAVAFLHK